MSLFGHNASLLAIYISKGQLIFYLTFTIKICGKYMHVKVNFFRVFDTPFTLFRWRKLTFKVDFSLKIGITSFNQTFLREILTSRRLTVVKTFNSNALIKGELSWSSNLTSKAMMQSAAASYTTGDSWKKIKGEIIKFFRQIKNAADCCIFASNCLAINNWIIAWLIE